MAGARRAFVWSRAPPTRDLNARHDGTERRRRMEAAAADQENHPVVPRGRLASFANAIYEIFRRCLLWIISAGPVPKHVAIIMDGNRRYASRRQMNKTSGHEFGYQSLMYTLRDCYDLGVRYVSIYAFSIENFRRSEEEVSMLMNMMHQKLEALIDREGMARRYGIRVQVLGDLSLLPEHVRTSAERAMAITKANDRAVLNICAPYTSTQEIVKAVEAVREKLIAGPESRGIGFSKSDFRDPAAGERQVCDCPGNLTDVREELKNTEEVKDVESEEEMKRRLQESITADEIERHLYTSDCPEPELLIRTSGETRLSNFLLWQSSLSYLYVTRILWPEFSFVHLIMAVIQYQKVYPILQQKQRELKRISARSD